MWLPMLPEAVVGHGTIVVVAVFLILLFPKGEI